MSSVGQSSANDAKFVILNPVWAIHLRDRHDNPYESLPTQYSLSVCVRVCEQLKKKIDLAHFCHTSSQSMQKHTETLAQFFCWFTCTASVLLRAFRAICYYKRPMNSINVAFIVGLKSMTLGFPLLKDYSQIYFSPVLAQNYCLAAFLRHSALPHERH